MSVVIRSGLIAATDYVAAFLAANGVTAKVDVGWNRRERQNNEGPGGANRVVFTPSVTDQGDGGTLSGVRFPGKRNIHATPGAAPIASVRSLANWDRSVLVSIWAADRTALTDQAAQIQATETLLEWVVRAVHSAPGAFAAAEFGKVTWTVPVERAFGLELRVELTFSQPIYDVPMDIVYPSAAAVARVPFTQPAAPSNAGDT